MVLAVLLLASSSREVQKVSHTGLIGLVGKSEKVDKLGCFCRQVLHLGADLHTVAILMVDIPERKQT
jgi:hypothetical protein